jgi:hypothetical protein
LPSKGEGITKLRHGRRRSVGHTSSILDLEVGKVGGLNLKSSLGNSEPHAIFQNPKIAILAEK